MTGQPEKRARGTLVEALSSALERGGSGLANVPELLRRLLEEESWREFQTVRGEMVQYERFIDFVTTAPLKGLGTSEHLVRKIVGAEPDDKKRIGTLSLLDAALKGQHGGDRSKMDNINLARAEVPAGTSREAGLRRLRKDRPDLLAEVLAGRLSTHAAMVTAGFRKKKISIPVTSAKDAAMALRRNLEPEQVKELAELLAADD